MTEFEWVWELKEGVKKIYSDMAKAGLPEPEYIEASNMVRLILRNNIDVRKNKTSDKTSNEVLFEGLSDDENIFARHNKEGSIRCTGLLCTGNRFFIV